MTVTNSQPTQCNFSRHVLYMQSVVMPVYVQQSNCAHQMYCSLPTCKLYTAADYIIVMHDGTVHIKHANFIHTAADYIMHDGTVHNYTCKLYIMYCSKL